MMIPLEYVDYFSRRFVVIVAYSKRKIKFADIAEKSVDLHTVSEHDLPIAKTLCK